VPVQQPGAGEVSYSGRVCWWLQLAKQFEGQRDRDIYGWEMCMIMGMILGRGLQAVLGL
jgi:hypothetical protein